MSLYIQPILVALKSFLTRLIHDVLDSVSPECPTTQSVSKKRLIAKSVEPQTSLHLSGYYATRHSNLFRFMSVSLLILFMIGCGGGSAESQTTDTDDTGNTTASTTTTTSTSGTNDTDTTNTNNTDTTNTDDTDLNDTSNDTALDTQTQAPTLDEITLSYVVQGQETQQETEQSIPLSAGATLQLTATAHYSDATQNNITDNASWMSSDEQHAKVINGEVKGLSKGDTSISVSLHGIEAKMVISVTESGAAEALGRIGGSFIYSTARNPAIEAQSFEIAQEAIAQIEITDSGHTAETKASGIAHICARLLESAARNPSLIDAFILHYDDFVAQISALTSAEELEFIADFTYQIALIRQSQIVHTARNPSMEATLDDIDNGCIELFKDVTLSADLTNIQDTEQTFDSRRAKAIGLLGEGMLIAYSRNPSVEPLFLEILNKALLEIEITNQNHDIEHKAAGIASVCSGLLTGIARNPSLTEQMTAYYTSFLEQINSLPSFDELTFFPELVHHVGNVRQAQLIHTSRNPSLASELEAIAEACIASINETVQNASQNALQKQPESRALEATGSIGGGLLLALARNPALETQLLDIANEAIAQIQVIDQTHTLESRANGIASLCAKLIESVARNPSLFDETLSPNQDAFLQYIHLSESDFEMAIMTDFTDQFIIQKATIRQEQITQTSHNPSQAMLLREIADVCIGFIDFEVPEVSNEI